MEHLFPDLAISYHEFVNIVVLSHIKTKSNLRG